MDAVNGDQGNDILPRRHRSARWIAAVVAVGIVGLVLGLGSLTRPKEEALDTAVMQHEIDESLRTADSLLLVGDRDHDTPDIAYIAARKAIARADSLAASTGIQAADSMLRVRADNSLIAARAALVAKADLFSDLPRLSADINARLNTLDSILSVFAISLQ